MDYVSEKIMDYPVSHEIDFLFCGKAVYYTDHSYGPYIKDSFLIVYIESGTSTLHVGNTAYTIGENNLVIFYPNSGIYYKNTEDCEWRIWWMGIDGAGVFSYLHMLNVSQEKPFLTVKASHDVLACFHEMNETIHSSSLEKKMLGLSLMYRIFSILAQDQMENPSSVLQNILHYIQYHYDTIGNIAEIHRNFSMSKSSLWRLFKQETGMSPLEYLTEIRCRRACTLLTQTDFPIQSIAGSIGYSDPLYFSRVFRKSTGQSPREYRRTHTSTL